jgi:putative FmdB family regulatory protein
MPTYDFECTKCHMKYRVVCSMDKYQSEKITECTHCGEEVSRSFLNAVPETIGTDGKRNMTSPDFWKNGKTETQIASVLSDETEPY